MHWTIQYVEQVEDNFDIYQPSFTKICAKNVFTYSFQWPRPLTWKLFYRFLITRVYHATKFKLSTALQFRGADENMHENDCCIFVPSDLNLWPFDHKIAHSVRGNLSIKYELPTMFQFRVKERCVSNNRQTDITKTMQSMQWLLHSQSPWPLDLKFTLPVNRVQCYVYTVFEVFIAFLLRVNWRHKTERQTMCNI